MAWAAAFGLWALTASRIVSCCWTTSSMPPPRAWWPAKLRRRLSRSGSANASIRKTSRRLPDAAARFSWKRTSAAWNAAKSSAPLRMAAIDISMSAISPLPARLAASAAMCTSSARRTSSRSSSARGSRRTAVWKKSPTSVPLGAATVGRRPCRISSSPRASRLRAASRTLRRLTPRVWASWPSEGSVSPGSRPSKIRPSSRSITPSTTERRAVASLSVMPE